MSHAERKLPGPKAQVYVDCDGVLADFEEGARRLFGEDRKLYQARCGREAYISALQQAPEFYNQLKIMPDADELMTSLSHLHPIVLSTSFGGWATTQKAAWLSLHFPGVRLITTSPGEKQLYCKHGDLLIDDSQSNGRAWIRAGGVFILHTSAAETLKRLTSLRRKVTDR